MASSMPVPDLIFTAISLPKLNGYALTRLIKAKNAYRKTVIVILSSEDGMANRRKGKAAGATDWVTKPFKPETIISVTQSNIGPPNLD
jgi:twitching motility two-component system response regulator PilG